MRRPGLGIFDVFNEVGLAVGIWYVIGVGYLIYLLRRHPDRIRDMDKVFD